MWITSTEAARKAVEDARERLVQTAPAGGHNNLAKIVNDIAEAEGQLMIFERKSRMDERDVPVMDQLERLNDLMARGADDTWSGRENDANRAYYDGVRAAASRVMTTMFDQMQSN